MPSAARLNNSSASQFSRVRIGSRETLLGLGLTMSLIVASLVNPAAADSTIIHNSPDTNTPRPSEKPNEGAPESPPDIEAISIEFDGTKLLDQDGQDVSGHVHIDVAPGEYQIVAYSADPLHREGQATQEYEQWVLEGLDDSGEVLFVTEPTRDLPDSSSEQFDVLGVHDMSEVSAVRARHARLGTRFPNSITPVRIELLPPGSVEPTPIQRCTGKDCDGRDPITSACFADAVLLSEGEFERLWLVLSSDGQLVPRQLNDDFLEIGILYSPLCNSAWLVGRTHGEVPILFAQGGEDAKSPCSPSGCEAVDSTERYERIGWKDVVCEPGGPFVGCQLFPTSDRYFVSTMVSMIEGRTLEGCVVQTRVGTQDCIGPVSTPKQTDPIACYGNFELFPCQFTEVSCQGVGCAGLSPLDHSCRLGAELLTKKGFIDSNWGVDQQIGLMYSPQCEVVWAVAQRFSTVTPSIFSSSSDGQTICASGCTAPEVSDRYVEVGWKKREFDCVPNELEFCEGGGRIDSFFVSPMVPVETGVSFSACLDDDRCTDVVDAGEVRLTLPCQRFTLFQCGGRQATSRADCLRRFSYSDDQVPIPNPIPERRPTGEAGEPEFYVEGDISLSELASYLAYFVDTEIPDKFILGPKAVPDPVSDVLSIDGVTIEVRDFADDVLSLPPLRETRPETVERLITEDGLMAAQVKILARLVCRVEDRLPPLNLEGFGQVVKDETGGTDRGVDLIISHNVLRALARGSKASGVPWDKIPSEDCRAKQPFDICYVLDGFGLEFDVEAFAPGIPANNNPLFYAMFESSEFGIEDPGDWYHYHVAAIVGHYGATGDILLNADFSLPFPVRGSLIGVDLGDPMGLIVSWIYSTMNQMSANFATFDYQDQAWWLLNSMSFLEAARDGRGQAEVAREMEVHRRGLIAGMSSADLRFSFSVRPDWCWYVADSGKFGGGKQAILAVTVSPVPVADWVNEVYSPSGDRRERSECTVTA